MTIATSIESALQAIAEREAMTQANMPGVMRRVILRFGGAPPTGSQQGYINCGVPGPVDTTGGVLLDGTGAGGGWPGPPTQAFYNAIDASWLKLDIAGQQNQGRNKISAIAIAPDSAIGACDIWFGGANDMQRHRLSPGNPLIADLSEFASAMVTPVRSMGRDDTSQAGSTPSGIADWLKNHRVWDAGDLQQSRNGDDGAFSIPAYSWPLRLELYFDGARPERSFRRAPYAAVANFILNGRGAGQDGDSANSEEASITVCTDGRESTDIIVFLNHALAAGGPVKVRVYGGDGYPSTDGNGDVPNQLSSVENWIAWDELDAGTVLVAPVASVGPGYFGLGDGGTSRPVRYSFRNQHNRYTFIKVIVECPHGADPGDMTIASGVIMVNAYD